MAQQASEAQQFSQRLQELTSLEAMILVRSLGHHIKSTGPFQAVMLIPWFHDKELSSFLLFSDPQPLSLAVPFPCYCFFLSCPVPCAAMDSVLFVFSWTLSTLVQGTDSCLCSTLGAQVQDMLISETISILSFLTYFSFTLWCQQLWLLFSIDNIHENLNYVQHSFYSFQCWTISTNTTALLCSLLYPECPKFQKLC